MVKTNSVNKAKALTKKDIEELSKKDNSGAAISLYVGVKADRNFTSEANSVVSSVIQKIKKDESYSDKMKRKMSEIADEIKGKIRLLKLPSGARSIVIFCNLKGMRRIYYIPIYIPSRFVVERRFYIHPLLKTLEKYPRYLVVFLERDKARFFSIFLGEIEEISEILCSEVPQRINAARSEWKGLRETKVQGHIQDHLNRHLKKVARKTRDYLGYKKTKFDSLVIGAHKELVEMFINVLDEKSKEKLVGSYRIIKGYRLNRIKEKSMEVISEHEKKVEAEIVKNLFDNSGGRKSLSAIGIDSVLESFYLHNVKMLVIGRNCRQHGYVCSRCRYISSYIKSCPKCKVEMAKADNIADEIVEEAIASKIKIKYLLYPHKKFDKFGIGAFLKSAA